jgi:hypothetical protein
VFFCALRTALCTLLFVACRSTVPSANEAPLRSGQALDSVHAIRSLMRVRATNGDRTDSFKAQLLVEPATKRVELTAYTPVGTSAMTIFADGDRVTFLNHVDRTAWEGSAQSLDFFGGEAPAAWALAVLGYPSSGTSVAYDPATKHATIARGSGKVDITTLETYSSDASPRAPSIPRDYQCCIAPKL